MGLLQLKALIINKYIYIYLYVFIRIYVYIIIKTMGGGKDVAEAELAKAINNYNPDSQLGSS
jgi:hypothetical protein